ncbi:Mitochondrial outer membrane protein porin 3 [Raphanus sativus]|nr:Mitochondrial outer membrane protein porin 3 [Raphanus sativus]
MGKGPRFHTEMEKRPEEMGSARKEYEFLSEIGLSCHNLGNHVGGKRLGNGPVVSTFSPANNQVQNKNFTANIKVASDSSDIPGLKAIIVSAKVELQNLQPHAGICTSVGLTANPVVNFSSVIGTSVLALGTDVSFDTESSNFKHFNASFTLNDKGERLNAPYYHVVNPLNNTVVGAEVNYNLKSQVNSITVRAQHALRPIGSSEGTSEQCRYSQRADPTRVASKVVYHYLRRGLL